MTLLWPPWAHVVAVPSFTWWLQTVALPELVRHLPKCVGSLHGQLEPALPSFPRRLSSGQVSTDRCLFNDSHHWHDEHEDSPEKQAAGAIGNS